jgi:hypothetical protein
MLAVRLQYQHGQFIPLDEVNDLPEGAILEATWPLNPKPDPETIRLILERSAGAWSAELADEIEGHIAQARQEWDAEWQQRLSSF